MPRVLIAESQPSVQLALRRILDRAGIQSQSASNLAELRDSIAVAAWDAILLGDELRAAAAAADLELGSVVIRLVEAADQASGGPQIDKRRDLEELPQMLETLLSTASPASAAPEIAVAALETPPTGGRSAFHSQAWATVEERIAVYAQHDLSILIQGESGTGKEVVARALHEEGPRKGRPFVAIHCGAIPADLLESELFGHAKGSFTGAHRDKAGRFEEAGEGTLLLDEIGEMSPALQAKLLRALETREFQRVGGSRQIFLRARVLAATHRDLEEMLAAGSFRRDLLHRLRVGQIALPPLRERPDDLRPLCEFFLALCRDELRPELRGLDPAAWERIRGHSWPGNARELFNVLRQATVLASDGTIGSPQLEAIAQIHTDRPKAEETWRVATAEEIRRRTGLGIPRDAVFRGLAEELESLRKIEDDTE